jgi:hypothetical protein
MASIVAIAVESESMGIAILERHGAIQRDTQSWRKRLQE